MPRIPLDTRGAETSFTPLPVGTYLVTIADVEEQVSQGPKTAGLPRLQWTYRVAEGEFTGKSIRDWTIVYPDPTKNFAVRSILEATGVYEEEELDAANFAMDTSDVVGERVVIRVVHREYQGETRDRIKAYMPESDWEE